MSDLSSKTHRILWEASAESLCQPLSLVLDGRTEPAEDPGARAQRPAAGRQAAADQRMSEPPTREAGEDPPAARPLQAPRPADLPSGGGGV